MNSFQTLHLLADLDSEHCQLNHGPGVDTSAVAAVDYLVLPVGYAEDEVAEQVVRELAIPLCAECREALQGEEWTLLYCLECGESRWVYRQLARNRYRHHVLWLKGCPDCGGTFGGLYFNDRPQGVAEQVQTQGHQLAQFVLSEGCR